MPKRTVAAADVRRLHFIHVYTAMACYCDAQVQCIQCECAAVTIFGASTVAAVTIALHNKLCNIGYT